MEQSQFREVPGYPGYWINQKGELHRDKPSRKGYIKVATRYTLYGEDYLSTQKTFSAAALVRLCFPELDMHRPKRTVQQVTRNKMSAAKSGTSNPNSLYLYVINGKKHETIGAATKHYNDLTKSNVSERTVQRKCRKRLEFCYTLERSKLDE